MPSRALPLSWLAGLAALLLAGAGCSSIRPSGGAPAPADDRNGARYLSAEDIERSGARNAWEALRRLGTVRLDESANGQPARIYSRRGRTSILLDDSPIVVLDGTRLVDFGVLKAVSAASIVSIAFLNSSEGTLRHGTGTTGGAIVILTRDRNE